jgi:tetratricopeptide (TPR) repeat protein
MEKELSSIHARAELAYEVLAQPAARKRYDQLLHASPGRSLVVAPELEDERQIEATRELVEGNLRQADELIESGQLRHAFTYLESASQMARDEDTLLKLAELAGRDPAWGRLVLQTLQRLTSSYPGCIEAWLGLSNHWLQRDDPERQRKALERALTVDPESEAARELYSEHFGSHALDRVLSRTETPSE